MLAIKPTVNEAHETAREQPSEAYPEVVSYNLVNLKGTVISSIHLC